MLREDLSPQLIIYSPLLASWHSTDSVAAIKEGDGLRVLTLVILNDQ
jgi:hypothetical protein